MAFEALRGWTSQQKHAVAATFFAWATDIFDYFVLVFVLRDVAAEFGVSLTEVAFATTLTLAMRPVGAFIFGRLADRYGRKRVLIADIALYSGFALATAFAPNIFIFLLIRTLFGVAMGGIWGVGASLAFETIKTESRGFASGLLQAGYPTGHLLASAAYALSYTSIGWRGLFALGAVPGVLVIIYMATAVKESPVSSSPTRSSVSTIEVLRSHWKLVVYGVLLMTGFNFFAHGTQDLYPTFLQKQHGLSPEIVGTIGVIYGIGAVIGGVTFGSMSQVWGRRRTIIIMSLVSVPVAFLWAYAPTIATLAITSFLMQVCVQAAFGVIPAHLNELAPKGARATFPGTVYQLGNLIAAINLPLQVAIAERYDYSMALVTIAVASALWIAVFIYFGREARETDMTA